MIATIAFLRLRIGTAKARSLLQDSSGAGTIEFALVIPMFLMLIFGVIDLGQMVYGQSVLNGAVQQAARNSTLEIANTTTTDQLVRDTVSPVLPGATVTSTRTNYYDFSDISRKEKWTDSNANGRCDNGEPYVDENGNGHWDSDIGESGNGSANDVVIYTVTAVYTPVIAIPLVAGAFRQQITLTSSAVKKNQPFANQVSYGTVTGTC
jgi:Flp pilus assembly protein TadG